MTDHDTLRAIAHHHSQVLVPSPGRSGATRLMCRSCTRQTYPCPTLRLVDQAMRENDSTAPETSSATRRPFRGGAS